MVPVVPPVLTLATSPNNLGSVYYGPLPFPPPPARVLDCRVVPYIVPSLRLAAFSACADCPDGVSPDFLQYLESFLPYSLGIFLKVLLGELAFCCPLDYLCSEIHDFYLQVNVRSEGSPWREFPACGRAELGCSLAAEPLPGVHEALAVIPSVRKEKCVIVPYHSHTQSCLRMGRKFGK